MKFEFFIKNHLEASAHLLVVLALLFPILCKKADRGIKIIFLHHFFSFILLGIANFLAFSNFKNLIWYGFSGLTSIIMLTLLFHFFVKNSKLLILYLGSISLVSYSIFWFFFDDGLALFSKGYAIICLHVVLSSIIFFRDKIINLTATAPNIFKFFSTWLSIALILYYCGSFAILITYRYITLNNGNTISGTINPGQLWGVHNVVLLLSCVMEIGTICYFYMQKSFTKFLFNK